MYYHWEEKQTWETLSSPSVAVWKHVKLHDFKMASNLPGSNEQTNKVDFRVFILRDHNFVVDSGGWRPGEHKQVKNLAF